MLTLSAVDIVCSQQITNYSIVIKVISALRSCFDMWNNIAICYTHGIFIVWNSPWRILFFTTDGHFAILAQINRDEYSKWWFYNSSQVVFERNVIYPTSIRKVDGFCKADNCKIYVAGKHI